MNREPLTVSRLGSGSATPVNELLAAGILGVVQGITEFLPVSSSGHLVLFQSRLPVAGDPVAFDLVLHLGTLVPVLLFYRADLLRVATDPFTGEGAFWQRPGVRLLLWMVLGSVPTGLIGITFEETFEALFANPTSVGVAFLITGTFLYLSARATEGATDETQMKWWQAVLIGIVQGLAITPGISRSGSTIVAGLFLGMKREYAARYSFLLSVPAILGACVLKFDDLDTSGTAAGPIVVGFLTAAVTGYFALVFLVRVVKSGGFSRFAWYVWAMAGVALALGLTA